MRTKHTRVSILPKICNVSFCVTSPRLLQSISEQIFKQPAQLTMGYRLTYVSFFLVIWCVTTDAAFKVDEISCNQVLKEDEGGFTSPGYPLPYHNDANCTYLIYTRDENRISLEFTIFDVENCPHDPVTIYDGQDTNSPSLGVYCGTDFPPLVNSTGNALLVTFVSDSFMVKSGFSAHYSIINEVTESNISLQEQVLGSNPGILVADKILDDVVFFNLATNIATRLKLTGLNNPFDVAVDPIAGYMFISNTGTARQVADGYILRTRLDGSESEIIVDSSIAYQPQRLVLNPKKQRVFFTNKLSVELVSVNYDGNDKFIMVTDNFIVGLAIDPTRNRIYWSDVGGGLFFAPDSFAYIHDIITVRSRHFRGIDVDPIENKIYLCQPSIGITSWDVASNGENGFKHISGTNLDALMLELVFYEDNIFVVSANLPYIEVMPESYGSLERLGESDYLSKPDGMTMYIPAAPSP